MAFSIFKKALDAVAARIESLDLDGDPVVSVRRLPHDGERYYDGITVHPVAEQYYIGTNERESVGYGCALTMVMNNDNDEDYKLDRLLYWRERIRRDLVEDSTLSGVPTTCTVKVEHGHPIDWKLLRSTNIDVSTMTVRVYSLENRDSDAPFGGELAFEDGETLWTLEDGSSTVSGEGYSLEDS